MDVPKTKALFWRIECGDEPDLEASSVAARLVDLMNGSHVIAPEEFSVMRQKFVAANIMPFRIETMLRLVDESAVGMGCRAVEVNIVQTLGF